MAHEFETGFFVGKPAWHGLGTVLQCAPTIDEALIQAGLNWTVSCRPLLTTDGLPVTTGHKATVRDTDQRVLGVVGSRYVPLQHEKAFQPFGPLVDSGLVTLEAAGSLRGGSRVWILAKLKDATADVVPGDAVKGYLLFYTGHDGTLRASYQHSRTRVVCMNTLSAAIRAGDAGTEQRVQLVHTASINQQVDKLTGAFALMAETFRGDIDAYQFIASKQCAKPELYFRDVLQIPEKTIGQDQPDDQGKRQMQALLESYETQPGRMFAAGSYWQAYNAVTYWLDHERGRSADTRLNSTWFGDGANIRNRAMVIALNA